MCYCKSGEIEILRNNDGLFVSVCVLKITVAMEQMENVKDKAVFICFVKIHAENIFITPILQVFVDIITTGQRDFWTF